MSAQVLQFPARTELAYRPSFHEFIRDELGLEHVRRVYRVKRRTPTFKGVPWGANTVLLTEKDYDAQQAAYRARFGKTYEWED